MVNIFVIIGVPLFSLILLVSRMAFGRRLNAHWRAGIWSVWVINVISLFIIASTQARQFNVSTELTSVVDVNDLSSDTLSFYFEQGHEGTSNFDFGDVYTGENQLISRDVRVRVIPSETEEFIVRYQRYARGADSEQSNNLASAIDFPVRLSKNILRVPRTFSIAKGSTWRGQHVTVIVEVPVGKAIKLDNTAHYVNYRFEFDRSQERPWLSAGQVWVMGDQGLVNPDYIRKNRREDEFTFQNFNQLQIDGKMKVNVEQGEAYNISMTGKPSLIEQVDVAQLGDILSISSEIRHPSSPIRVTVTMPSLQSLDMRNTDDVKIQGFTEKNMSLRNSGRYDLKVFANIDSLSVVLNGENALDLQGKGHYLKADLGKRTKLDAERFSLKVADITSERSSRAKLVVSDTLFRDASDVRRIQFEGQPFIIDRQIKQEEQE